MAGGMSLPLARPDLSTINKDWLEAVYDYSDTPVRDVAQPYFSTMSHAFPPRDTPLDSNDLHVVPNSPAVKREMPSQSLLMLDTAEEEDMKDVKRHAAASIAGPASPARPLYNPEDFDFPEEVLEAPLKELNQYIKREQMDLADVKRLKKERRRFQSRGYARKARKKKLETHAEATTMYEQVKNERDDALRRLQSLKTENKLLRAREKRILRLVNLHQLPLPELLKQ
jgi:hypothetical protein